ncbi:ketoacyl-ACP synthase III [Streptomyces sp. AK02-04a]|nr:ketoacyl-ACP synthase III [Streptomyces sp. AK02-04a]
MHEAAEPGNAVGPGDVCFRRPTVSAVVAGLGAFVPPRVVDNTELATRFDVTPEWIVARAGVERRHIATSEATSDLALEAAARALKSAGSPAVDAVVLATTTPDHPLPATAPMVASRLGLGSVAAFDVAAVCSGFVYALAVANGLISSGQAEQALVIGADTLSSILDPQDPATNSIFADGAGAVVLRRGEAEEPGAVLAIDLGSDGSRPDLIAVPDGGSRRREPDNGNTTCPYLQVNGSPVFINSVKRMAASAQAVMDEVGWLPEQVDWLVPHQANIRIVKPVVDRLRIDRTRALVHLDQVGNTSAASIPLALTHGCHTGRLKPGQRVVLTAFGGGLTWGSAALIWPDVH